MCTEVWRLGCSGQREGSWLHPDSSETHGLCCCWSLACQTAWFDDGDLTGQGDSELLQDLRKAHLTGICSDPLDIEAQTISGIPSLHTKNTFHRYDVSEGFECLHFGAEDEAVR
ncbi:hypothetical protein AAFF_G00294820 [Aldrovandia affinis]|uniref:WxxW domain-containing protein n=1 Tax=Aldrovandia affinis TaxID=143900 RepID=A0AAD7R912_9TELE|nr:hypothetical protein AAFF_G00294820 [Aldrovandia affinis]